MIASGTFTCLTTKGAVAATNDIRMLKGTTAYTCSNTIASACQFSTSAATTPTVTAVSLANNAITFTGSNFPAQADYTAKAVFKSATSDAVLSWTATSLTATFTNGVPAAAVAENAVARIFFKRNSDSVVFVSDSTNVYLTNTVSATAADSTAGLQTSFAGGLSYTITKSNVFASLKEPGNNVSVCGNICELDESASNSSRAVCKVPALATTYSVNQFKIKQPQLIEGAWTGSVAAQVSKVTDGVWPSEYTDPNANCWIEIDFPDTQVGVLDQVKILINNLSTTKAPFAGVTKLQGFDGTAYVDILTLDATIHEGWNTFEWTTNKPAYQKYKWSGATAGSCRIGEIKYTGIVAVNDNNPSMSCTPKLKIGTTVTDLSSITYINSKTASVTSIVPRYGAVQGGE